ncbi:RNF213 [Mytilus edulis]|uniref:RNF213 n=1 Tax=Mytilus edulis TaxID=6550 RepID=A0A8S3VA76_MYTED|nr:RNF213 [Mytilus edulis]
MSTPYADNEWRYCHKRFGKELTSMNLPFEIIFGSSFEEDLSDDYNYRILSRIILCMEQGMVLILKDLESIYGSLYDMLNQNYTIVDSTNKFLSLPLHDGIEQYFENTNFPSQNSSLSCIFTYSSIHSNIPNKFESKRIQRDKLAVFKSEKQFTSRVENFYHSSDDLLILQCLYSSDWQHILLAKVIIEKYLRELKRQKDAPETIEKKVCIVVHLERFVSCDVPLNFLSGWNLLFLDTIAKPETNLQHFYNKTKLQIVKSKDLKNFINESLFWALSRIQFTSKQNSLINLEEVLSSMHSCGFAIEVIKELIITYIQSTYLKSGNWCICVANDSQALLNSATYINALEKTFKT